ncbi:hypothetical protein [Bradyrhizobium sp. USDA 4454]
MLDLDGKRLCAGFTGIFAARATPWIRALDSVLDFGPAAGG